MTTDIAALSPRHEWRTKLVHAGLALAVIVQLLTSLVLEPEEGGHAGNLYFDIHEYSGLTAFVFVLAFWLTLLVRRRGTPAGQLWPWFSGTRLAALWADFKRHGRYALQLRLPPYDDSAALPPAIHGLGVALMTAMAASGTIYYFINQGDPDAAGLVGVVMFIHTTLANLVWAYLIGHAGFAVIQHLFNNYGLQHMWSLRPDTSKGN